MKPETILNALEEVCRCGGLDEYFGRFDKRSQRQYFAFRARILRMFEVMESECEMWRLLDFAHCEEKDARIAELEKMNERLKDELKDLIADARWLMG